MADKLENEVRYFLRASEDVIITLETFVVRNCVEEDTSQRDPDSNGKRRVLAVVTHQGQAEDEEEGRYVFYCALRLSTARHLP
jgi:hypothetical protein